MRQVRAKLELRSFSTKYTLGSLKEISKDPRELGVYLERPVLGILLNDLLNSGFPVKCWIVNYPLTGKLKEQKDVEIPETAWSRLEDSLKKYKGLLFRLDFNTVKALKRTSFAFDIQKYLTGEYLFLGIEEADSYAKRRKVPQLNLPTVIVNQSTSTDKIISVKISR